MTEINTESGSPSVSEETATPAAVQSPSSKPNKAPMWLRILQGIAGLGLFVGFLMPWVHLGGLGSRSGVGLVLNLGGVDEELSGVVRGLILGIPLVGIALLVTSIKGFRALAWAGLAAGIGILLVGVSSVIILFLDSTRGGMWVVTGCAFVALATGALSIKLGKGEASRSRAQAAKPAADQSTEQHNTAP